MRPGPSRRSPPWPPRFIEEAANKLADNAIVRYHLGMPQLAAGNKDAAKRELQQALKLQPAFPGADEARRALSQIQ